MDGEECVCLISACVFAEELQISEVHMSMRERTDAERQQAAK